MRVKVGGAGTVELVLDGSVDEGDDGGVEVVDESALGDFLTEVGAQKKDNYSAQMGYVVIDIEGVEIDVF